MLPKLFERLGAVATTWNSNYEIICVDDGSRDRTWEILKGQSVSTTARQLVPSPLEVFFDFAFNLTA